MPPLLAVVQGQASAQGRLLYCAFPPHIPAMPRHFNTAGPVVPADHYCIDPLHRMDWVELHSLIAAKKFFVLHAPRQTGKTSTLLAIMDALNHAGEYTALYFNVESGQSARNDVAAGMQAILGSVVEGAAARLQDTRLRSWWPEIWPLHGPHAAFKALLSRWAQESKLPIVLLIDEVDALVGDTLISLLRQLREGYIGRPGVPFVHSAILCGVRDVRDYRIHTAHHEIITGGSAFNIKAKSLVMGSFTQPEVHALYAQHTAETGQVFAPEIYPELWADTQGQPWLVNALGHELTWEDKSARDRSTVLTLAHYKEARERLIQSRATHLEQLSDKLKESRVRAVIEPLLKGVESAHSFNPEEVEYVIDLGLIQRARNGALALSNRIYQEVIPRELSWGSQMALSQSTVWYLSPQRRLLMPKLLTAFQQFFREHSESWIERFSYKEAGPQLLLQAFLQRIVNGGGRISREYGLGRKRTDLYIEWPLDETQGYYGEVQRIVLELKLLHKTLDATLAEGLEQTAGYADLCGAGEQYLIIFDRRPEIPWETKIWQRDAVWQSRAVGVWGM